jgi:hypothetical protein
VKNIFRISLIALSGLAISAQANNQGTFGAHLGWGIPKDVDGVTGGLDIGLNADWTLSPAMNVGLYATYQMLDRTGLADTDTLAQIPLGVTANFNLLGGPGLYAGVNLGTVVTRQTSGSASESSSELSGGGQLGFDFPLTDIMSGGFEFRYIHIFADESTYLMNANVQVKVFF